MTIKEDNTWQELKRITDSKLSQYKNTECEICLKSSLMQITRVSCCKCAKKWCVGCNIEMFIDNKGTPTSSHIHRDGAASKYEREKRQHYSRVSVPSPLPPRSVIPFVLEATGRLGPSALLFLHTLCGTQTFLRSRFLSDINLICARTAGRMLKITRDRFRGLHQGVLLSPMYG